MSLIKAGRLADVNEEMSYRAMHENAGCMGLFLACVVIQFFIVMTSALEPVLKIRTSMSVVERRGRYGRRE